MEMNQITVSDADLRKGADWVIDDISELLEIV